MGGIVSGMTYWVEQMAWEKILLLDNEFDEWEYGQEIEQRYRSRLGTYGTYIPTGKAKDEYKEGRS